MRTKSVNLVKALKVFFDIKTQRDWITFIIAMIMSNGIGVYSAYGARIEWQLQQELAQRGVLAEATIVDCGQLRNGTIWFEFEAVGVGGKVERYKVRGGFREFGCIPGDLIWIKYLPDDPSRAAEPGPAFYRSLVILSCLGFTTLWVLMLIDFIKRKRKGLV